MPQLVERNFSIPWRHITIVFMKQLDLRLLVSLGQQWQQRKDRELRQANCGH